MINELNMQCKKQKVQPCLEFKKALSAFLIHKYDEINKPTKKAGARIDSDMETFSLWKNFLSQTNLKSIEQRYDKKKISGSEIMCMRKYNQYLFIILKDIEEDKLYQFSEIQGLIKDKIEVNGEEIKKNFNSSFKYTQPLKVEFEKNVMQKV